MLTTRLRMNFLSYPVPACVRVGLLCLGLVAGARAETWVFKEPRLVRYESDPLPSGQAAPLWLRAYPAGQPALAYELGSRVSLRLAPGTPLATVLGPDSPLQPGRTLDARTFILQAKDAVVAAQAAQRLAERADVEVSCPVMRRPLQLHGSYAARPNDPYYQYQWHLENRGTDGALLGVDINARAAWPYSTGAGVTVGVVDSGIEMGHPELAPRLAGAPHYNFLHDNASGAPVVDSGVSAYHGTGVAGLITAASNNQQGLTGLAPDAAIASLLIFGNNTIASNDHLMDMFQHELNTVAVQNHSWGTLGSAQIGPTSLEESGIANAYANGRGGKGRVIVRAAGNFRTSLKNVSDDGYASDPRVITVAAIQSGGRAASYSNPGAAILVAAPSGDTGVTPSSPNLFTTDRLGLIGANMIEYDGDLEDYGFDGTGFNGTSAATPLVSGIAALMLSANPALTVRDVQQILVLSARHYDLADPSVQTNGAGLRTSMNVGFGVPDAGVAVQLARHWTNRPARTTLSFPQVFNVAIPELSTRLIVQGPSVPANVATLAARPTDDGPRADKPTANLPVQFVGYALTPIASDLRGKGALIERGSDGSVTGPALDFTNKIMQAALAGASFAIVYNNTTDTTPVFMNVDDFSPIPAVFLQRTEGLNLLNYLTANPSATVRLETPAADMTFNVSQKLICEHVGVKLTTTHTARGDLRILLTSPSGTVSVLQRNGNDQADGPQGWTYYSTQHFFEPSAGVWKVSVVDEIPSQSGNVTQAELILHGVTITDTDNDGLDDAWETARLGGLTQGPKGDPDLDGYNNAREQLMGTNPLVRNDPLAVDYSVWNETLARLSWPGSTNRTFTVEAFDTATQTPTTLLTVPGRFPVTECFVPRTGTSQRFYRVKETTP